MPELMITMLSTIQLFAVRMDNKTLQEDEAQMYFALCRMVRCFALKELEGENQCEDCGGSTTRFA